MRQTEFVKSLAVLALVAGVMVVGPWARAQEEGSAGTEAPEETSGPQVVIGDPLPSGGEMAPLAFKTKDLPTAPPEELKEITGAKVWISLTVAKDGTVADSFILKSSVPGSVFTDAVKDVAKTWTFEPPKNKDGSPATANSGWSVVVKVKE